MSMSLVRQCLGSITKPHSSLAHDLPAGLIPMELIWHLEAFMIVELNKSMANMLAGQLGWLCTAAQGFFVHKGFF